ncbi:hypothetical protein V6Z05_15060 [Leptospira venezuelensis]|uniref:hypothetical protein n=1 Tax=Leptospira venezuelensis TaxID=1958811 RepID=UPI000A3CD78F|nr:hypothetical protein [Leptospira venezuelensis]
MTDESDNVKNDLEKAISSGKGPAFIRVILNLLGGVPVVGSAFSAGAGAWSETEQARINKLLETWLKIQAEEVEKIAITLTEVFNKLDLHDPVIEDRIASDGYLNLIKKVYRDWSAGESEKKRFYLRNLLTNAAASQITPDTVISLFIDWVSRFSELHLDLISLIYQNKGITRFKMWQSLYGEQVREDSAEADLFKLVVHDLSIGHVIR